MGRRDELDPAVAELAPQDERVFFRCDAGVRTARLDPHHLLARQVDPDEDPFRVLDRVGGLHEARRWPVDFPVRRVHPGRADRSRCVEGEPDASGDDPAVRARDRIDRGLGTGERDGADERLHGRVLLGDCPGARGLVFRQEQRGCRRLLQLGARTEALPEAEGDSASSDGEARREHGAAGQVWWHRPPPRTSERTSSDLSIECGGVVKR